MLADVSFDLRRQLYLRLLGDVFDVGKLIGEALWCVGFIWNGFWFSKI